MSRHLTSSDHTRIVALAAAGTSAPQIAREVGCSLRTVQRKLSRNAAKTRARRSHVVKLRLSDDDRVALDTIAKAKNLTRSALLRHLVRRSADFIDFLEPETVALRTSANQLNAMARNLMRLLKLAHAGNLNWSPSDARLVSGLSVLAEATAQDLITLIAASRRGAPVALHDLIEASDDS